MELGGVQVGAPRGQGEGNVTGRNQAGGLSLRMAGIQTLSCPSSPSPTAACSCSPHPTPRCRKYGWNYDEINAGSRTAITWFHMGLTVVDSLDTLLILGLEEEFIEARQWVANHLDFEQQTPVSVRGEGGQPPGL